MNAADVKLGTQGYGAMKMEDSAMALNLPFSQLAAVILTCGLRPVIPAAHRYRDAVNGGLSIRIELLLFLLRYFLCDFLFRCFFLRCHSVITSFHRKKHFTLCLRYPFILEGVIFLYKYLPTYIFIVQRFNNTS